MSYPHPPVMGGSRPVSLGAPYRQQTRTDLRPPRPAIRTRRYEIAWLAPNGEKKTSTQLAPATPFFEEAFSAFARGTLIQATGGPVAIEDLSPGDRVQTAEGRLETITWIGSMTAYPAHAIPQVEAMTLTRLIADALGLGRPMPDLLLGPRARILVRDARCAGATGTEAAYAPARAHIDGDTVVEVRPAAPISMYHLVLEHHGSVRAGGLDVEAYHPGPGLAAQLDPQMMTFFLGLFPQLKSVADFGALAWPRISEDDFSLMIAA